MGPEMFLSLAGRFLLLASGICLSALLVANAAIEHMVAPPLDPADDTPWVKIAPSIAEWPMLEAVEGASAEQVVERLGPPLRVHRGDDTCDRCAQTYVYAALLDGERVGIGVCINQQGLASGSCGSGMRFDIRTMTGQDDVLGMVLSWPLMVVLALPFALLRGLRVRAHPLRLQSVAQEARGRRTRG